MALPLPSSFSFLILMFLSQQASLPGQNLTSLGLKSSPEQELGSHWSDVSRERNSRCTISVMSRIIGLCVMKLSETLA